MATRGRIWSGRRGPDAYATMPDLWTGRLVPWGQVEEATVDLRSGRVRLTLAGDLVAASAWLRGVHTLVGCWVDRVELEAPPTSG